MNAIRWLTGGRTEARRHAAAALAIALGTAFVAIVLLGTATLQRGIESRFAAAIRGADVVVTSEQGELSAGLAERVAVIPGVTGTHAVLQRTLVIADASGGGPVAARTVPDGVALSSGVLPRLPGDIVATPELVASRGLRIGDTLDVREGRSRADRPARVSGIAASSRDVPPAGLPLVYAADADLRAWSGRSAPSELHVRAPEAAEHVRDAVAALPEGSGLTVRTAAEEATYQARGALAGLRTLSVALLAFAVVAVFVAGLVIANTFAMAVAARTRRIALQRCVGATGRQVRIAVLAEAAAVGLVGSLAGLALGAGLVGLAARLGASDAFPFAGLALTPTGLMVPLLLGVVVTLVSALAPARQATRVAPLAALRPEPTGTVALARGRVVAGVLFALGGTTALAAGAGLPNLPLGVVGGLVSFVGVLVLAPVVVPAAVAGLRPLLAHVAGLPGDLAAENARRNPRRSAATVGALLVGVSLVTMMVVGAESGRRTIEREMARQFAVDAVAVAPGSLPERVVDGLRRNPAVTDVAAVPRSGKVTVDGREVGQTLGIAPEAAATTRYPEFFDGLTDGTVALPPRLQVAPGTTVTLRVGNRSRRLVALPGPFRIDDVVVTTSNLAALDPGAPRSAWVRFAEDIDDVRATTVLDQLGRFVTASMPDAHVQGPAPARARVFQLVDLVLQIAVGLSAVAVVIALVGVGNTLGLSILERTRENGLLRALGLTRRGLRATIGIEALLLGGVAVVVGLLLGVGYGIAGTHALLGSTADEIVLGVPAGRLLALAVAALTAAWLASVVPARRAGNTSPCAALTHE